MYGRKQMRRLVALLILTLQLVTMESFWNISFLTLFEITIAILVIVFSFFKWKLTYWQKHGFPTLDPVIPFGDSKRMLCGECTFGEQFLEFYKQLKTRGVKHGGVYLGPKPFYLPLEPELVKHIMQNDFQYFVNHGIYMDEINDPLTAHLFNLEDEKWKKMRTKLTPTFTSGKLKMMFQTLADCSVGLKTIMNEASEKQKVVDIKDILGRFTTDIIGSVAFGLECNSLKDPDAEFRKYGKRVFEMDLWNRMKMFAVFILPHSVLKAIKFKPTKRDVEKFFMKVVKDTVEYREKNNISRKDFMHLLLQLKNRGNVTDDDKITDDQGKTQEVALTMNELAAQAYVFFIAGFETSSTTMTFALYELASNPEIQDKLRDEINTVLEKYNDQLTYDGMMEMTYMEKVINETLRKYPPAPVLFRKCNKNYNVPNTSVTVKEGVDVAIPVLGIQNDAEYYPNPETFDPERFSEENKNKRPAFTWLPFGEGPRVCIGLRFGMLQTKVGLTALLKNYRIKLNSKTKVPLKMSKTSFITSAEGGIWLDVEKLNIPCFMSSGGAENNLTIAEVPVEVPITTDDDSEQELSSQLQEVDSRSGGWSSWSEWSACSRSCDGGVSHQLRTCKTGSCRGDHVRYKICNMQSCPETHEFREVQCSAFNSISYQGSLYEWSAHYDDSHPCALTCKGKPISDSSSNEDPVLVVAKLADKVHDGTRCRLGSLDMCIEGKCQRVGCDLRIGSTRQVDECGVCGGDGSSCSRPLYHWTLTYMSLCSVTCGGGYKMSRPLCQNRVTGEEVGEELCNESQKPDSTIVECNTHNCPPKWHAGDWGPCSVSCGGGSRLRQVYCVEEANNTKIRVNDQKCTGHKPWFQEACNRMDCPAWIASSWSGCSVSCGEGTQVRVVECRDSADKPSSLCLLKLKPNDSKPCSTGIQCPHHLDTSEEFLPGLYHTQPLVQPYPPPPPAHAERLVGEQVVPSESTFVPDEWGPCSVTCGEGIHKRQVHCKIFLEFSRTIAKLPDKQCTGPKPIETEKCYMGPCSSERIGVDIKDDPYRTDIKVAGGSPGKSYSWKEQGYTHCSATCLGGVQELIVNCVRDDTQKVTSPYLCPIELKPEILMRTCNDHPCPPRWNYSDFSQCSQSCGIGIQTREVNCIHEVTQGGGNTVIVPNNMCPQPPPPDRQYCNVLDCPVRWKVSEWSKCSKPCGGGEKIRKVECKQVMAQNHTVDRSPELCPSPKPPDRKPCNTKSCIIESDKPHIDVSNSSFIQHDFKKKKIALKVGGAATVFIGTTVKIKCPVKRFNRTKIQWMKDKSYLPKNKKYKSSKKGALRVQNLTLRDSGRYTCIAGRSAASIQISVRPKPGEFLTSEEIQKQGNKPDRSELISDVYVNREDTSPIFSSDDHSHEQRPDVVRKKPTSRTRILTPTLPSLTLDSNNLNAYSPQGPTVHLDSVHDDVLPTLSPASSSESLKPFYENSASSAGRILPHFQRLISNLQQLWPFQTFSNSRGHRMVAFPEDSTPEASSTPSDEDEFGSVVVLGKGTPDNLKFEWVISDWSKCSQTCGGNGFQMRAIRCIVRLHNMTHGVDHNLCEDAGLAIPATERKCGLDECPRWVTSEWTPCEKSKCFAWHTAMQRRVVKCQIDENVTVAEGKCDDGEKPTHRQECTNERCVGKWKLGAWSECSADCEMPGFKYRILQCVWYGTKKPAGTACKDLTRPPVMKTCKGPPCSSKTESQCRDHSMFCSNVKTMNMCKIMRYQQQCCKTCKAG